MHIKIKKGLNIPILGQPKEFRGEISTSKRLALDLKPLPPIRFQLLFKEGEKVLKGQPLLRDKEITSRVCISPVTGKIVEVVRGNKRAIETVIIEKFSEETFEYGAFNVDSKENIVQFLCETGLIMQIQMRPFCRVPNPDQLPKKIFIRGIETAPYLPPMEMQVDGMEVYFQEGLALLSRLVEKNIHLVFEENSKQKAFLEAKDVHKHTISGPHPAGLSSIHIHYIDPIETLEDITWTLSALDVVCIGHLLKEKKHYLKRICSIAGDLPEEKIGFYKVDVGVSISDLLGNFNPGERRLISGDPLMGKEVSKDGFLGFFHTALSVLKAEGKREPFHFLKLGMDRYTQTRAYGSWFSRKKHWFSSLLHGEQRPFIDANIYDKVMPMNIPTTLLIKALLAEDFERAKELGVLEISPEDMALPTFVCPSKIEMVSIVEEKLKLFYEMIH